MDEESTLANTSTSTFPDVADYVTRSMVGEEEESMMVMDSGVSLCDERDGKRDDDDTREKWDAQRIEGDDGEEA